MEGCGVRGDKAGLGLGEHEGGKLIVIKAEEGREKSLSPPVRGPLLCL